LAMAISPPLDGNLGGAHESAGAYLYAPHVISVTANVVAVPRPTREHHRP
jgi:hypothetical protein